ncbi:hypothetical protein OPIT5_29955 [Opitutaceae bacterium TAV5]|nr:hypothetical protein OPIT5_29955 [Opitutaceae bacterium TAV5]
MIFPALLPLAIPPEVSPPDPTMQETVEKTRTRLVQWAERCLSVCQDEGDTKAVSMIQEAVSRYRDDRFVLSVMGLAKRGKSTLINALLGRADDLLAPVDKLPATSVTTTFSWGQTLLVEAILRNGTSVSLKPEDIRAYATEEGNPGNIKEVQLIRITGPFPERLRGLTLVDLPGLGSVHEHHDQILHQFLPQSDAVLLLTTARMPINEQELDLLRDARKADIDKLFVAINQMDKTEPGELLECEAHNRKQLGLLGASVPVIHKISARQAFLGEWEASGVSALWADIETFLQKERGVVMTRRLVSAVMQAASPVLQSLATLAAAVGKSFGELAAERARLTTEKKSIESTRQLREREFKIKWDNAVDETAEQLPQAEKEIRHQLTEEIKKTGLGQVKALEKRLPGIFARCVESTLSPIFSAMENTLRDITREFDATYPRVSIDAEGSAHIEASADNTLLKGAVAGGAMIAGGVGVATAASAAIAAAVTTVPLAGLGAATTLAGGALSYFGLTGLAPVAGGVISALWPTATVSTASPLLLAAGPVGWALAGVGALAVPVAWSMARSKRRRNLQEQIEEHVADAFSGLKNERLPAIRRMAGKIIEEFRINLDHRLVAIDLALEKAALQPGDAQAAKASEERYRQFDSLLAESSLLIR